MFKPGKILLSLLCLTTLCNVTVVRGENVVNIVDHSHGGMRLQNYLNSVFTGNTAALPEDVQINITLPDECSTPRSNTIIATDLPEKPLPGAHKQVLIGRLPVVIAVAKSNPADDLTIEQLRLIYTGRVRLWSDLGVEYPQLIVRAGSTANDPVGRGFRYRVMGQDLNSPDRPEPGKDILPGVQLLTTRTAAETMAQLQDAIIITGGWELVRSPHLKILKINGIAPTEKNILQGKYPLFMDHRFLLPESAKSMPRLQQILDFFRLNAVQSNNML